MEANLKLLEKQTLIRFNAIVLSMSKIDSDLRPFENPVPLRMLCGSFVTVCEHGRAVYGWQNMTMKEQKKKKTSVLWMLLWG